MTFFRRSLPYKGINLLYGSLPALLLAISGCSTGSAPAGESGARESTSMARTSEGIQVPGPSGRQIYATSCAECHGANGEGAEKGISLIKGHALYHSSEDFIKRVTNGKSDKMPAFKGKLSEAEIAEVVRYVREDIQGPYVDAK